MESDWCIQESLEQTFLFLFFFFFYQVALPRGRGDIVLIAILRIDILSYPSEWPFTLPVWQFKFAEDFAKAAAEELDASNLFKEAFFTSSASAGDLVLCGDIKSTRYWGKVFSYGFSINAPGLWFLGLPQGTIHNELEVEFTLVDQANGVLLWNKSYKMAYHKSPFWIYKIPSDFDYDNMFKAMMRDVVKSLESTLSDSAVLDSR
ncbi:MAG: hypothetical protein HYR78_02700 [Nitrospirae bacterium]|nr:hypothetical protein [Nitrospirota bacterium]